jgi:hypothetical protein
MIIKYLCFIRLSILLKANRLSDIDHKEILMNLAKPTLGTWLTLLIDFLKKDFVPITTRYMSRFVEKIIKAVAL